MKSITVIVPHLVGAERLARCLRALAESECADRLDVVVVQNPHAGQALEPVDSAALVPQVRVLRPHENLGYAGAVNFAAATSLSNRLLILNDDAYVERECIAKLSAAMDANEGCVISGAVALYADRPTTINSAGVRLTHSRAGFDNWEGQPASAVHGEAILVGCVSGVCMLVDSDWWRECGGFAPDFFAYYEDVDLCLRAWLDQRQVILVPQARVLHEGSATAAGELKHRLTTRNRLRVIMRTAPGAKVPALLVASITRDAGGVLRAIGTRDVSSRAVFRAKARGLSEAISGGRTTWQQRRDLPQGSLPRGVIGGGSVCG